MGGYDTYYVFSFANVCGTKEEQSLPIDLCVCCSLIFVKHRLSYQCIRTTKKPSHCQKRTASGINQWSYFLLDGGSSRTRFFFLQTKGRRRSAAPTSIRVEHQVSGEHGKRLFLYDNRSLHSKTTLQHYCEPQRNVDGFHCCLVPR